MADTAAVRFLESIYARVDKQVRDILATLPSVVVPAQDDGVVVTNRWRILNFQGPGAVVSEDALLHRTNVYIPGSVVAVTAATHVLSALGAGTKAMGLWNGSSNDSPPANWQTTAYDDSAWSAAVSNTEAAVYSAIISGAAHLWASATGTNTAEIDLVRQRFTVPVGEVASATLTILGDSQLIGCWINGTLVATHADTPWGSPPGSPSTALSVPVSPSVFLANPTTNVIACEVQNNLDPTVGGSVIFDLSLTMNNPTPLNFTSTEGHITGDVTLTTQNTFYDGPTVSLTAGTWLLNGAIVAVDAAAPANIEAKLWDGTNVQASAEGQNPQAGACLTLPLNGIVTVTSTTTWKISVTNSTRNGGLIKAAIPQNAAGNTASYIKAVKISG